MTAILEARRVHKRYGGAHALRGVDFALQAGEIHALIGANGAGKSTLCKIIAGIEAPTDGELLLRGLPVRFASVREAAANGIDIVHQELSLFPDLTVAENLFLGRELTDRFGLIDYQAQREAARKALGRLGQSIGPDTQLGDLPVGLRQIVEIAKALVHDTRVLLMDEPTSALSPAEIPVLFKVVRSLAAEGVAIVYISHRLDELLSISERVTVLRDGRVVAQAACCDVNTGWIVREMTGREGLPSRVHAPDRVGAPVLRVSELSLQAREGRAGLTNVSFEVAPGEVLGFYGLMGAGRTELFEAVMGMHRDADGGQQLEGRDLRPFDVAGRIAAGVALVPEDRQRDGLFPNFSVLRNMTLSSLAKLRGRAGERSAASGLVETLRIKAPSLDHPIQSLSGGNQQKVVLSRCLMQKPRVLMLDEPTRGVDVAAKVEILDQMRRLAGEGAAVLFASSDASEILGASTRILVMSRGRVALETTPSEATEAMLSEAAAVDAERPVDGLAA